MKAKRFVFGACDRFDGECALCRKELGYVPTPDQVVDVAKPWLRTDQYTNTVLDVSDIGLYRHHVMHYRDNAL